MHPNVLSMTYQPGGYIVDSGHAFAGAVVTMRKRPWNVVSIRPTMRYGPAALVLLVVNLCWLRTQLSSKLFCSAIMGTAIAILIGFGFGLAKQFGSTGFGYSRGNPAMDAAIFAGVVGCIVGFAVPVSSMIRSRWRNIGNGE